MPISIPLNLDGTFPEVRCECCAPRYIATTFTITSHKWIKQEIESEIQRLAFEMTTAKWYERGNIRRRIKHWVDKLQKYNEAEQEFNFNKRD